MKQRGAAFLFDASHEAGLGHYSRARAFALQFQKILPELKVSYLGIGTAGMKLHPKIPSEVQAVGFTDQEPMALLKKPMEFLFVDSYRAQDRVAALLNRLRACAPELKIALFCDQVWDFQKIPQPNLILDSTYALDGVFVPGQVKVFSGPAAVMLNPEYRGSEEAVRVIPGAVCMLGGTPLADRAFDALRVMKFFGHENLRRSVSGSAFGYSALSDFSSEVPTRNIMRDAEKLIVTAGQTLWEAALQRKEFFLLPLNGAHRDILKRLTDKGILHIKNKFESDCESWQIFNVEVNESARDALTAQDIRANQILAGMEQYA